MHNRFSVIGEHRLIGLYAETPKSQAEAQESNLNELDELQQDLQRAIERTKDPQAAQESIEKLYDDVTDTRVGLFGALHELGVLEDWTYETGPMPYTYADMLRGGYPSPWGMDEVLGYDDRGFHLYNTVGPMTGVPHYPGMLPPHFVGLQREYGTMADMVEAMLEGRYRGVRTKAHDELMSLVGQVIGERGDGMPMPRMDQSADGRTQERKGETQKSSDVSDKVKKKADFEKQLSPLKDEEAVLRKRVKELREAGKEETSEFKAEQKKLADLVEKIMGIQAQMQALEGDKNNPDGKPVTQ